MSTTLLIFQLFFNCAGSFCSNLLCIPVPSGYFSTPVSTGFLVATNLFANTAAAIAGTAANGGLTLAIAVGGTCSTTTVGCTAGSYCKAAVCTPVPSGYYSTPVSTTFLVAGNIFATQAAAVTGTAANGGLTLAIAVGGVCAVGTVGCTSG